MRIDDASWSSIHQCGDEKLGGVNFRTYSCDLIGSIRVRLVLGMNEKINFRRGR
jgi:hypothetical protein